LLEFCDPAGVALCPRCGLLLCRLRGRLASLYGADPDQITLATSFVEDLGADSLDVVELVMELEEEFGVRIPDDEAERIKPEGVGRAFARVAPAAGKCAVVGQSGPL
jgi:acyl carrier protein